MPHVVLVRTLCNIQSMWYIVRLDSSRVATLVKVRSATRVSSSDPTRVKSNYIPVYSTILRQIERCPIVSCSTLWQIGRSKEQWIFCKVIWTLSVILTILSASTCSYPGMCLTIMWLFRLCAHSHILLASKHRDLDVTPPPPLLVHISDYCGVVCGYQDHFVYQHIFPMF